MSACSRPADTVTVEVRQQKIILSVIVDVSEEVESRDRIVPLLAEIGLTVSPLLQRVAAEIVAQDLTRTQEEEHVLAVDFANVECKL